MEIRKTRPISRARPVAKVAQWTGVASAQPQEAPTQQPADMISLGIPSHEMTPRVQDAVVSLLGVIERLRRELADAVRHAEETEHLADKDPLLPVGNRRAFMRDLGEVVGLAERYGTPASLIYVDVNEFKPINDTFGHAAGDAALAHIVRILVSNVRAVDVVARLGGDEFALLLPQTEIGSAALKAEALAALIREQPLIWQGAEIPLSVSWGVTPINGIEDAGQVLDAADRAMYQKKKTQRQSP